MNLKRILGLGLAGIIAFGSCSTIKSKIPETYSVSSLEDKLETEPQKIRAVPFYEFFPTPKDFSEELNSISFKEDANINFRDEKNIQEVFSIAEELGFSEDYIKKISIHDAVLLSGMITVKKMEYPPLSEDYSELQKQILPLYEKNADENFSSGLGVCGQYAEINIAIFNLFKSQNPSLKNVIMRYTASDKHAWNEVITPESDDSFLFTAVDATTLENAKPGFLNSILGSYNAFSQKRYPDGKYYRYKHTR